MVSTAKNTFYSSINVYVEYFIGFVLSILIARTLGPEDFGDYSYFVKICSIAIILTNAGINTGVVKFIAEARAKGDMEQVSFIGTYFRRLQFIKTIIITSIVVTILALFPNLFISDDNHLLLVALTFVIFFKSAHMFRINIMKGCERFDLLAAIVIIVCPINLIIVSFAYYKGFRLDTFIYIFGGISFVYWLTAGLFLPKVWKTLKQYDSDYSEITQRINHHIKVVSISAIVSSLGVGQAEVLLLKPLVGSEAVSFFTIGATISTAAFALVPGVYSAILLPVIARALSTSKEDAAKKVSDSTRHLFILSTLVAVPTALYGQNIVSMMYGDNYAQAGWVLSTLILIGIIDTCTAPLYAYMLSADRQTVLLKLNIVLFFVTWSLNYYCIYHFGLQGAVFAVIAIILFKATILTLIAYKTLDIAFDFNKFIRIIFASLISTSICLLTLSNLSGVPEIIAGFSLYLILFICAFLFFGSLNNFEYQAVAKMSTKQNTLVRLILTTLIKHHIDKKSVS